MIAMPASRSTVKVSAPRFEHSDRPLGIGVASPRLSWQIEAPPLWEQCAWEIRSRRADGEEVFRNASADQILVQWPFAPLTSRERAEVSVRVQGMDGQWSPWSEPATVEAGLLDPSDWLAQPVGASWDEEPDTERRPALVRRSFHVDRPIRSARLYVTAHGLYEAEINGERVGDHEFAPGWTKYDERLVYWTHDVTAHLRDGENVIGAWLGDGWYRGRLGFNGGYRDLYGTDQSLIAQLEITHTDGTRSTIATSPQWEAAPSPILRSSLYDGEQHDAREERPGWSCPGGDAEGWTPVQARRRDPRTLVAPALPPVRCTEEISPVSIAPLDDGGFLLDFGQNLVGRLRLQVDGAAGHLVELRHAEVLEQGELGVRPLRLADAHDVLVLDGQGPRTWEPKFTFHGFRYATVHGLAELEHEQIVARVLHTDMVRTGWLETSSPDVNRLHENVLWGMRGNFLSIPTDCPQRDERLGWTGDIQVFAPTATYLYDCAGFLESWLVDLELEQLPDGTVPWFVPVIPGGPSWTPIRTGAIWGDAAVLTPWVMYERFADEGVLLAQYDSARAWVERMIRQAGESRLWKDGHQLGDWLDPNAPPHDPAGGPTDKFLVATAYFAYSTARLADIAALLGHAQDEARYRQIAREVREAFREEYVTPEGTLTNDGQTAYALAIRFGLLTEEETVVAGERLAALVREADNRIATGFAGTPIISDALTDSGHVEAAFDLLLEDGCPSWLYTVRMGATTMWERWDSMLPDGTINPGEMTSFNHYALGSVADWMHRAIGGIEAVEPGYRRVRLAPRPGPLTSATARHDGPYGRITSDWSVAGGEFTLHVALPVGSSGIVVLPDGQTHEVGHGEHTFTCPRERQ